jgi:hypothetical protein
MLKVFDRDGRWRQATREDVELVIAHAAGHLHTGPDDDGVFHARPLRDMLSRPNTTGQWALCLDGDWYTIDRLIELGWVLEDEDGLFPEPPHPDTMTEPPF